MHLMTRKRRVNSRRPRVERVGIVTSSEAVGVGGIHDYSRRLARTLRAEGGIHADLIVRHPNGGWIGGANSRSDAPVSLATAGASKDFLILQYNPFMYGRWGFAPSLPTAVARAQRIKEPPRMALMIHEPYVPMKNARWVAMGLWQRLQLLSLRIGVEVVFTSVEAWAERFEGSLPHRPTFHLPVASNLPDRRPSREEERLRLRVDDSTVVVAALGTGHESTLRGHIADSLNKLAANGHRVVFLNLGAGAPRLDHLDRRVRIEAPGVLPADDLARRLSAVDIFLSPLVDGVSTRRTSLMAALQHQLAVVGTGGPLTDSCLTRASNALQLRPVMRRDLFSDAVLGLAADPGKRSELGREGRRLYEHEFDWPILCSRLLQGLSAPKAR
jgi:glycosyltransferase involved in cell wall biosynthesis